MHLTRIIYEFDELLILSIALCLQKFNILKLIGMKYKLQSKLNNRA